MTMAVIKARIGNGDVLTMRVEHDGEIVPAHDIARALERTLERRFRSWFSVTPDGVTDFDHRPFFRYDSGRGRGTIVITNGIAA